ncbi:Efflux pump atB [Exophiala dermatitidis]
MVQGTNADEKVMSPPAVARTRTQEQEQQQQQQQQQQPVEPSDLEKHGPRTSLQDGSRRRSSIDIQSIISNEEPVPVLEPPPHHGHHGHNQEDHNDIRYEYLTFETEIDFDEIYPPSTTTTTPSNTGTGTDIKPPKPPKPPNLKKYESPLTWSSTHKTIILILSCYCTFAAAYSAGAYSIASAPQRQKWNLSQVAFSAGVTTWCGGFALSPMILAPFSEINGRRPVFIGSAILFLAGLIACATTPSYAGMLVARFFVGAGASTFATMVGGVVSDLYDARHRNTPMAIYSGSALAGTGIGPLCSGFIVGRASFRWIYYHQIISLGIMVVVVWFFFKETRGSVLLSRKARVINEYLEKMDQYRGLSQQNTTNNTSTGTQQVASDTDTTNTAGEKMVLDDKSKTWTTQRIRYKVLADESRSSLAHMLYLSITLPFKLLATEPVVFFFSLWVSFAWALLYMTFSVLPLVFSTRHGFTTEQNGAVFASISIGTILATVVSIYQAQYARTRWPKLTTSPEGRLYFACLESILLPIGLFWFGWTTYSSVHWISPVIAIGVAQMGIFVIYLAVFNYLADVYHRYASSALAAQSFMRNMMAAVFPLFTVQMFRNLGYPGASSLLGGISALLTVVPWVLLFNGEKIRARSKIARQIMTHSVQVGADAS